MTLGGRRFLLGCAVIAAGLLMALAVSLPFIRLTTPALFAYAHSLISTVTALAGSGQLVLAGVVLVFAIFLPVIKLLYLVLLATLPSAELSRSTAQLQAIDWLGRWSPHDVIAFVLAFGLALADDTAAQRSAAGAYALAGSVAAMLLAYAWLRGDATAQRMRAPALRTTNAAALRGLPFAALLGLAAACFTLGVTLPAVRLTSAYAGADLYSAAGLVLTLYGQGEPLLASTILALAIVLPAMRLLHLLTLALWRVLPPPVRSRVILSAEGLGRFASADTMILALMLVALIAAGEAHAELEPGAYCFIASALLTMLAYAWTNLIAPSAAGEAASLKARLAELASADTAAPT